MLFGLVAGLLVSLLDFAFVSVALCVVLGREPEIFDKGCLLCEGPGTLADQ